MKEGAQVKASNNNQSLHITVNGKPYKQHELGSGLQQFILVLANASVKKPNYVLIDEPESNLHPRLQLDFLTTLSRYASAGVWFSTHSIGLARSVSQNVYVVKREGDGDSSVQPLASLPRLAEFLGEMSFSAHKELGFEKIVLVEGPTDVTTFQEVLRKQSKDHKVVLLPLHGRISGDMAVEIEEIMRITTDLAVIIDSEKKSAADSVSPTRQAFVKLCTSKGIKCHVLDRRATENYFSDDVVKAVFGDSYRALGPYEKLDEMTPHWTKAQNSKLANAMTRENLAKTDLGKFFEQL